MQKLLRKSLALLVAGSVAFATLAGATPVCAGSPNAMTGAGAVSSHEADCGEHDAPESAPAGHHECLMLAPCSTDRVVVAVVVFAAAHTAHDVPSSAGQSAPSDVARAPETPPPRR